MLDDIRIVLINTSHPGNIGAAARAMKTMGLKSLYLVNPDTEFPHPKAMELASGAQDVLEEARVTMTLVEAIHDRTLVLGTSTRLRTIPIPMLTPKTMVPVLQKEKDPKVAILFGCERSGLSNDELRACHYHIQIPANPYYSSLNLASAVQIICYELYALTGQGAIEIHDDFRRANVAEMSQFYDQLREVLIALDFLKIEAPRQLMTRLKRLFNRLRPDVMEMNILRGILSAIMQHGKKD